MAHLTDKQEKYCLNLFKGMSQRQAYRDAYKSSKTWKNESVDNKACALANSVKVKARLDELRGEDVKKSTRTRSELLNKLYKAFDMALGVEATPDVIKGFMGDTAKIEEYKAKKADLKSVATIADRISKLEGWDKPQQVEIKTFGDLKNEFKDV